MHCGIAVAGLFLSIMKCQCCDCELFIPDHIGDGKGLGKCKVLEWVKANQPESEDRWFKALGNKVFWGGDNGVLDRDCSKFKNKETENSKNFSETAS